MSQYDDQNAVLGSEIDGTPDKAAGTVKWSLIVATMGRTAPLARLFDSLLQQESLDCEIIIVDQNLPGWLDATLAPYRDRLPLVYLRSAAGASRARNVGLRHARGELITFPDDDCWFTPGFLAQVTQLLDAHPEFDGLGGRAYDPLRKVSFGRWPKRPAAICKDNAFDSGVTFTLFLRRAVVDKVGMFDETLGPGAGTPWGSGEETDYVLRAVAAGCKMHYDPNLVAFHEAKQVASNLDICGRAVLYGQGKGRVLRKHGFGLPTLVYELVRPLVGACLQLGLLRLEQSRSRLSTFRGRLVGLTAASDPNWK